MRQVCPRCESIDQRLDFSPLYWGEQLRMWWNAQDLTSITLASGAVSDWASRGRAIANATQGTAANRPTFDPVGLNGRPCLTFDGTNDTLTFTRTALGSSSWTVACAYQLDAVNSDECIVGDATTASASGSRILVGTTDTAGATPYGLASVSDNNTGDIKRAEEPTGSCQVAIFKPSSITLMNGPTTVVPTDVTVTLMTLNRIGSTKRSTAQAYFNGRIGEIIVLNARITVPEEYALGAYLASKWGVFDTLNARGGYGGRHVPLKGNL